MIHVLYLYQKYVIYSLFEFEREYTCMTGIVSVFSNVVKELSFQVQVGPRWKYPPFTVLIQNKSWRHIVYIY